MVDNEKYSRNDDTIHKCANTAPGSDRNDANNGLRTYAFSPQNRDINRRLGHVDRISPRFRTKVLYIPIKPQRFYLKRADVKKKKTGRKKILSSMMALAIAPVLVWILSYYTYAFKFPRKLDLCNMQKAENRDFNKFYGIDGLKNHFTTPTADECDTNIIFKPPLPQAVLKSDGSASSFMTLAKYGTGKTLLRCAYFNTLKSNSYFKILVLNKQISEYVERFVVAKSTNGKSCDSENCLIGWSKNEFAQLILSVLATEFVNRFEKDQIDLQNTSLDEKIELITILCYYYNGIGVNELENFINNFLDKTGNEMYKANTAIVQIQEQNVFQDKPLLTHFKNDLNTFSVLRNNKEKLHLLLSIVEKEGFQHKSFGKTMYGNEFSDLNYFALFIKNKMNKTVVFILDGIDENRYFFQQNEVNKVSLESFSRSSISQELLSMVMAHYFYLSIFYPAIEGINIQDAIIRNDKFPTYTIDWDTKSLINYADYVLQEMSQNAASSRCKSFVDFKTLVNYSNEETAEIINLIPTPRALHYFMEKLITEMNNCANDGPKPFIATLENVRNAYEKSKEYFYKRHSIKG